MDFILVTLIFCTTLLFSWLIATLIIIALAKENGRLKAELRRKQGAGQTATRNTAADVVTHIVVEKSDDDAVKAVALLQGVNQNIARKAVLRATQELKQMRQMVTTASVVLLARKYA